MNRQERRRAEREARKSKVLGGLATYPSDLPPDVALKVEAAMVEVRRAFEGALSALTLFPEERVSTLCRLLWNLIGAKITPTVIPTDPDLLKRISGSSSVNYMQEFRRTESGEIEGASAAVCVHPRLPETLKRSDLVTRELAAIVFCASQCADYWNGKFRCSPKSEAVTAMAQEATARARIYEAEFMLVQRMIDPKGAEAHTWGLESIAMWPQGWKSKGADQLWYEPKRWED